jgi:hypothetical protein
MRFLWCVIGTHSTFSDEKEYSSAQQLSNLDALEGHINDFLARLISMELGKRGRRVAAT